MTKPQPASAAAPASRGPEASFRYAGVSASVFVNTATRSDGTVFPVRRVVLQRTFKDKDGQFQSTSSFDVNDLPKVLLAAQEAYKHCLQAAREQREPGEEG